MQEKKQAENLSRRDFFRQGTTVVAGAAGLAVLGAPAILRAQNVNSKINCAMIGTGSRGGSILSAIKDHPEVLMTDVCDIYPPNLAEGKSLANNGKVRAHTVWEKVLEQKDVDAVIVSTPLFLHVPMSIAALEAGKHVFSEKSQALNVRQLNQMREAVKKHSDKVYLVGYQSRLNESLTMVRDLLAQGSFGRITQFYVHFDRNLTWRKEDTPPEWERVLNWRLYKEYCGGLLTEVVTHEVDQIIDLLGVMPASATFYGKIMVYQDGRENHDSVLGTWEMENGVLGVGSGHLASAKNGSGWLLLGTHGSVESYGGTLKLYWETQARHLDSLGIKHKFTTVTLGQSLKESENKNETPAKVVNFEVDGDYDKATAREFKHFYDCVLNGAKPVMDLESTRRTSIAALMAYTSSMDGGRKVSREEVEAQG